MKNMEEQTELFIREHGMTEKGDVVIAGVSGGADSVCLLFILCGLQETLGFRVKVCHVNHGLRGRAADADEEYVRELCARLNVPCRIFREDVELIAAKRKQSLEEAGRAVRREAFLAMCREDGGTKIATAHHRDDNAETMLLNMARGTGQKGLCGIRPVQGKWIRPLLAAGREQIEEYLTCRGISWCSDATNEEDDYTRNRIRHNIIPLMEEQVNSGVVRHLEELSAQAREVWEYLEQGVRGAKERCVQIQAERSGRADRAGEPAGDKIIRIGREAFSRESAAIQKLLLKECIADVRGAEKDIGAVHLKAVMQLFDMQCGKRLDLPGGVAAYRTYGGVEIRKKDPVKESKEKNKTKKKAEEIRLAVPGETLLPDGIRRVNCRFADILEREKAKEIPQKSYTKWIDYDIIKHGLSVRTRQSGDYLEVDGRGSRQKLKAWFINEKIPRRLRDEMILVADGHHIVWIPGWRMSRGCQISNRTEKILEIKITEDKRDVRDDQSAGSGRKG